MIRCDVAVIERSQREAAVDHVLDLPSVRVLAAAGVGRPIVLDPWSSGHPALGQRDPPIVEHRVVAAEIKAEDDRRETIAFAMNRHE